MLLQQPHKLNHKETLIDFKSNIKKHKEGGKEKVNGGDNGGVFDDGWPDSMEIMAEKMLVLV